MMAAVSDESRIHPRLRLDAMADVIGTEVLLGQPLDDISVGGCRFAGPAWEAVGTELQVVVGFPSTGSSIPVAGLVVRASERDMGVRFHQMSDGQKWALRKCIREVQSR